MEQGALVFTRMGRELVELAATAQTLQDNLTAAMASAGESQKLAPETLQALQSLDLLTQSLDALGTFCAHVGQSPATRGHVDLDSAIGHITLSHLARRLAGNDDAPADEPGFELF